MNCQEIITELEALANPEKALFKAKKYNITAANTLGIYQSDINDLAKKVGKNSVLALELYDTDIYEAKLLCAKIFKPKELTIDLMNNWCSEFDNWEICDTFCMKLFAYFDGIESLIPIWCNNQKEFIRRAGFATIAALCMADKKAANHYFESFYPVFLQYATDNRVYVKKAISWAIRNIGKRNIDLHKSITNFIPELVALNNSATMWIVKDVNKELTADKLRMSDYPRNIYRLN